MDQDQAILIHPRHHVHVHFVDHIGDPTHQPIAIPSQFLTYNFMPTLPTFIGDINRDIWEVLDHSGVDNPTIAQSVVNTANLGYKILDPATDHYCYFT